MKKHLMALAAIAMVAGTSAVANDFVVKYDDLDLSSAKDRKVLEHRIDNASRVYCGADTSVTGSRVKGVGTKECVASARKLAREQLATLIENQVQKGG